MAIGRISGSVLKSNLTRNGTDLAFETNLLYIDVTNSRIGVGTSEPSTTFHVNGNATITGELSLTGNFAPGQLSFSGNQISTSQSNANLDLSANGTGTVSINGLNFPTADGEADQFLKTDGAGGLSFATVSTNSISEGNSNVTVTDSGTGAITIDADGSTIVTFNATTAIDASAANNALRLPNGSTAERPSGSVGMIRYNSSTDTIEGYTTAGGWAQLGAATAAAEDSANVVTGEKTAISTLQTVVDSFLPATYDSAFYLAVTRDEINEEVATAKYSVVHNDSSAFVSQSSITQSGSNEQIVVDADVSGGNVRLLATGTSVVNSVSFYRIGLGDNTTQATTGNVTTEITADVDSAVASIDSWTLASARGAKYFISVNNATTGELSNIEAMVVHDGSSAYISSYNAVNTGNNDLITLTAEVDSTAVVLKASANAPNCRVTAYRILLADDETSATGDFIDIIGSKTVDSSATALDTFLTSVYTGAHYVVVGYNSTEGSSSIQEVTVVSDGAGAFVTTGPLVSSKDTDQLTFTAELSGTTVTLRAASSAGSSTTVNAYRVHLLRGIAGASTANTVLVDTTQTITGAKTFDSPIALTVGADPATVADKAHIYAKDESSSAEVYVRDEAGNVTKISPHNQQGEWEYYSRNTKTGKTVRVNMEEMIRDIEKLTGKTYIQDK